MLGSTMFVLMNTERIVKAVSNKSDALVCACIGHALAGASHSLQGRVLLPLIIRRRQTKKLSLPPRPKPTSCRRRQGIDAPHEAAKTVDGEGLFCTARSCIWHGYVQSYK